MDIQQRSHPAGWAPEEPGRRVIIPTSADAAGGPSFAQQAGSPMMSSYLPDPSTVKTSSPIVQALVQPAGSVLFPSMFGSGMPFPTRPLVPSEPPVTTADTDRARIVRAEALAKLKKVQDELSTCDVGPGLMPQYLSLLKTLALDLSAAKSVEQLEAVDLHLSLVNTAWERTKRNEAKRRWALMVAALVFAVIVAALLSLSGIIYLMTGVAPIISNLVVPGINVPVYVLLWSAIGSCSAVLYRINRAVDLELEDPVRLMVAQPIISVVMGTVSYLIVRLGLLTLTSDPTTSGAPDPSGLVSAAEERATYFLSFMAFLVGFSDRFANGLLRTLAGRFGGDRDAELVTPRTTMVSTDAALLNAALEVVGRQGPGADAAPRPDAGAPDQEETEAGGDGRANGAAAAPVRRPATGVPARSRRGRVHAPPPSEPPVSEPLPVESLLDEPQPIALAPVAAAAPLPAPANHIAPASPGGS